MYQCLVGLKAFVALIQPVLTVWAYAVVNWRTLALLQLTPSWELFRSIRRRDIKVQGTQL